MTPVGAPLPILTDVIGGLGVITLNRPQALNALSLEMVREMTAVLRGWASDASVQAVLLRGSARAAADGKRTITHFCAGGDIRFMHDAALAGDAVVEDFFTEEYALDHLLHVFPKPTIAWLEGVTMGGGMGLAQGCKLRVATETLRMAMPETRIGLFPDVGGGHFLSRCAGAIGEYLGVVGPHFHANDAMQMGLADVAAASSCLPSFLDGLCAAPVQSCEGILGRLQEHLARHPLVPLPETSVMAHVADIDRHFSQPTLADIVASLQSDRGDWAKATLAQMSGHSPLMMAVTLEQIRRGRGMALADVFRMERTLVRHCFQLRKGAASETIEGVRALVIDKDNAPKWVPASVAEVSRAQVDAYFQPVWPPHAHPLRDLH